MNSENKANPLIVRAVEFVNRFLPSRRSEIERNAGAICRLGRMIKEADREVEEHFSLMDKNTDIT